MALYEHIYVVHSNGVFSECDFAHFQTELSSSGQLQESLLQLRESSRDKAILSQKLREREEEIRQLEKVVGQVRGDLLGKEREVLQLRELLERTRKEDNKVHHACPKCMAFVCMYNNIGHT